jgi:hypothetical protein
MKINKKVEVKELINSSGDKRFFRISIPREIVRDAIGNAPKAISKTSKPLADESSSDEDDSFSAPQGISRDQKRAGA